MSGSKAAWISGFSLAAAIAAGSALATIGHPGAFRLASGLAIVYVSPWISAYRRTYPSTRPITVRFLACTLAIVVGIGFFELPALVGLIDYRRPFAAPTLPWERPGNRADLELLYVKEGHERVRESFTGNETPWLRDAGPSAVYQSDRQYDRDGFRNSRDLDRADVVLIGDSFIEGAHVNEGRLVSTRLAKELGRQKTVVNLGQAGYGPEQELYVLRRFGLPRKPVVCVWAFYEGNDLADIDEYKIQRSLLVARARSLWGTVSSIPERSFTANALGHAVRTWIDPPPRRPASQYRGWFKNDRGERVPVYFASGDYRREAVQSERAPGSVTGAGGFADARPQPPDPVRSERIGLALDRLRAILTDAGSECHEHGAKLVVVFIPTKLRVYRPFCTFEEESACEKWPIDDLPKIVGTLISGISSEIAYLDLTPHFQAEAARGALLYLPDDTHWTADGHRSAARAIAESIVPSLRSSAPVQ